MKRTTITLTDAQHEAIAELMRGDSRLDAALGEVVERLGLSERPRSEAGVVRMLIDFAWQQVNEVSLELGYQEMAEWYNDDPERKAIDEVLDRDFKERLVREEQEVGR